MQALFFSFSFSLSLSLFFSFFQELYVVLRMSILMFPVSRHSGSLYIYNAQVKISCETFSAPVFTLNQKSSCTIYNPSSKLFDMCQNQFGVWRKYWLASKWKWGEEFIFCETMIGFFIRRRFLEIFLFFLQTPNWDKKKD